MMMMIMNDFDIFFSIGRWKAKDKLMVLMHFGKIHSLSRITTSSKCWELDASER